MAKAATVPRSANGGLVKSADRVMAVLDLVAKRGALPFSEISESLALPKSSAHSLLRTMEARGYLSHRRGAPLPARQPDLGARPGHPRARGPAGADQAADGRGRRAHRRDRAARDPRRVSARLPGALGVPAPGEADLARRRAPARHTSAIGKALLADARPGGGARGGSTAPSSSGSPTTRSSRSRQLLEELERTRERGLRRRRRGVRDRAALHRGADPRPRRQGAVAAISVSMPTPRYSRAGGRATRAPRSPRPRRWRPRCSGRWQG